ncbi:MAG: hypothetical protein KAR21_19190 [Spirochaetales bacterium]|nr:hypothetical protein [Spirochaetales bacterium]
MVNRAHTFRDITPPPAGEIGDRPIIARLSLTSAPITTNYDNKVYM